MTEVQFRRERPASVSSLTALIRWLQLKNYQYEVTFSLYMLTSTEKLVFNSILFVLISLLVTAAYCYLPAHLVIIYTRVWYYISGEFTTFTTNHTSIMESLGSALQATKEVLITQTASSVIAKETMGRAKQVVEAVREEL